MIAKLAPNVAINISPITIISTVLATVTISAIVSVRSTAIFVRIASRTMTSESATSKLALTTTITVCVGEVKWGCLGMSKTFATLLVLTTALTRTTTVITLMIVRSVFFKFYLRVSPTSYKILESKEPISIAKIAALESASLTSTTLTEILGASDPVVRKTLVSTQSTTSVYATRSAIGVSVKLTSANAPSVIPSITACVIRVKGVTSTTAACARTIIISSTTCVVRRAKVIGVIGKVTLMSSSCVPVRIPHGGEPIFVISSTSQATKFLGGSLVTPTSVKRTVPLKELVVETESSIPSTPTSIVILNRLSTVFVFS